MMPGNMQKYMKLCNSSDRGTVLKVLAELTKRTGFASALQTVDQALLYQVRQIGAYYQSRGIKVIPTISWAEEETFKFCFKGIPKGSIVSISTIGVKRDEDALKVWKAGVDEMVKQIEPSAILIYGGQLDYDFGNIKTVYFNNQVTENWKAVDKEKGD